MDVRFDLSQADLGMAFARNAILLSILSFVLKSSLHEKDRSSLFDSISSSDTSVVPLVVF